MRKGFKISKDDLCYEKEIDEAGFVDYIPPSKNCVSLFSFTDEEDSKLIPPKSTQNSNEPIKMVVQHKIKKVRFRMVMSVFLLQLVLIF